MAAPPLKFEQDMYDPNLEYLLVHNSICGHGDGGALGPLPHFLKQRS